MIISLTVELDILIKCALDKLYSQKVCSDHKHEEVALFVNSIRSILPSKQVF